MKFKLAIRAAAAAAATSLANAASAVLPIQSKYNLAPPVTQIADEIYSLHTLMLLICGVIFVLVFGVMFYSIWKHRASKGAVAETWHENTKVEIIWTVIPFLIVIGMAIPATKTVVAMKDTSGADVTIKATGYQWKWGYDYLRGEGEGISFVSALATPMSQITGAEPKTNFYLLEVTEPLVVPVGKKIRLITTAADVIHSWWVPAFGVKQDAIPGFARDTWFRAEKVGTYRGDCAELCGKDHGFMPIVVEVKSAADYAAWAAAKKKAMAAAAEDPSKTYTLAELKAMGAQVYEANCQVCHQPNGKGLPNAFPALDGSKVVNGSQAELLAQILNGKNAMPAWKGVLSATQIAAVTSYIENSWGNATGKAVQPADVQAATQ
ncbi:MAG: cytochrome c oxidase subunit II [Burkholderiaceae bacterium]